MIAFESLTLSGKPNQHLLAPEGLCRAAIPHAAPRRYDVPVAHLEAAWEAMLAEQPRLERVARDPARHQLEVIQRSFLFRFPDRITVRFLPDGPGATLAVFSRAELGYSDFGVNRRRVDAWVAAMEAALPGIAAAAKAAADDGSD